MPYNWDEAAKLNLLLAIIHIQGAGAPNWNLVAKMLGEGVTYDSTRKQFAKLKKEAQEKYGEFEAVEDDAKPKAAAKKGGKRAAAEEEGGEDGASSAAAPAKKGRKPAAKGKGKRKGAKDDDGDEEPVSKKVKAEENTEQDAEGYEED